MTCFTCCFRPRSSFPTKQTVEINAEISSVQNAKLYSYKELQIATENFSPANKIGEGGFGSVYKGRLNNGTLMAIKVLSAQSEQGVREFLSEIVAISGLEHENLVKLYGCCTERDQRILVYGYLENNSLARTLLGGRNSNLQFSWKIRTKICIGVARGLAFLHEEVEPHIVHRDIKASNILLDKDFTPKISDFGLAKLFPETITHVSTRVAGTFGYLAPEYAIRGKLTRKADIYSFGVLLLEIVSGRPNKNKRLSAEEQNLLEMAWTLYEKGKLVQLVDNVLDGDFDTDEASRYLKVGLLCTQELPKNRPSMSTVAKMLKGEASVDEWAISKPGLLTDIMTLKSSSSAPHATSSATSKTQDKSSSSESTNTSHATMTFSSIYDRS
ncbi:putative serine/threonine-protein kinase isoform X2 [Sesamum indicum]|uniref:Serine/threonine-protein kinase isoform X2 n=1 Tax=Sesamum indicum TaxID=4182 RepID=A0A8M8V741_SESIN|nr:putative serine/threonine-protein kinase isoform X2 [Sesamum indicum]